MQLYDIEEEAHTNAISCGMSALLKHRETVIHSKMDWISGSPWETQAKYVKFGFISKKNKSNLRMKLIEMPD